MNDRQLHQAWKNRQRPRRVRTVGELVSRLFPAVDPTGARRVAELEPLWLREVPVALQGSTWLMRYESGCLYIAASDSGSRFEVERVVGPRFLRAVQAVYPEWGVRRFRVILQSDGPARDGRA